MTADLDLKYKPSSMAKPRDYSSRLWYKKTKPLVGQEEGEGEEGEGEGDEGEGAETIEDRGDCTIDEELNEIGPGRCETKLDCKGARSCNDFTGFCQGEDLCDLVEEDGDTVEEEQDDEEEEDEEAQEDRFKKFETVPDGYDMCKIDEA